jgi:propanol-preferring alcohol dehydrogenase
MSDILSFPSSLGWDEWQLVSMANLARRDGLDFPGLAPKIGLVTKTTRCPLQPANQTLVDIRAVRFEGAAVLMP